MKRTVIFVDHENLGICARDKGIDIDYCDFKDYLASEEEGRSLVEAFCYMAVDPRREHGKDAEIRRVKQDGWLVKAKVGTSLPDGYFKCNLGVELTMDMVAFSYEVKPDIVILVTGDQDFAAVVLKLRERGIRVEVAAFSENISNVLLDAASGFIDLNHYFIEADDTDQDVKEQDDDDIPSQFEKNLPHSSGYL
jgi:uncharacterized LabA/DUF88 family protein